MSAAGAVKMEPSVRRAVAEAINRHTPGLAETIVHELQSAKPGGIPPALIRALHASVQSNIRVFAELLHAGEPMEKARPNRPIAQLARALARHQIPLHRLIFLYHSAHNSMERQLLPLVEQACRVHGSGNPASDLFTVLTALRELTSTFITTMEEHVATIYEDEAKRTALPGDPGLLAAVKAVVAGETAEDELGDYVLADRPHQAVVVWTPGADPLPEQAVREYANRLATHVFAVNEPLVVFPEHTEAWIWVQPGAGHVEGLDDLPVPPKVRAGEACAAIGPESVGLEGFRRTHRRALALHRLAVAAPAVAPQVIGPHTVGAAMAAAFAHRLEEARDIVVSTLGELAVDDRYEEVLRETARSASLYGTSGASDDMTAHRNTVKYRLNKFKEALGMCSPTRMLR